MCVYIYLENLDCLFGRKKEKEAKFIRILSMYKTCTERPVLISGMDLPFEWDEVEAFVRQPDGSLFTWCEHFRCYNHIIYGIVC